MKRLAALALVLAVLLAPSASAAVAASAAMPALYRNCTNLNKRYPHGLGKNTARDRTTGTPVTSFKRSTRLYNIAMSYNPRSRP